MAEPPPKSPSSTASTTVRERQRRAFSVLLMEVGGPALVMVVALLAIETA